MTKLSVNLNKVALIRNSRETRIPSVVEAAKTVIGAGAEGITVHPRPDQRHIRPDDVYDLAELLADPQYRDIEFNIEGNPYAGPEANGYPGFMALVDATQPQQATLVPDDPGQLTSDHGWDLTGESNELQRIVDQLKAAGIRVSLFMDPDDQQIELCARLGADRIEYYTGPYAEAYPNHKDVLAPFIATAHTATSLGLGINAGHDLNLDNLETFCREVPGVAEVSIGHAIITDALWLGWQETITRYRKILDQLR
jgi:pyridoxine 5-phosphate synthase